MAALSQLNEQRLTKGKSMLLGHLGYLQSF